MRLILVAALLLAVLSHPIIFAEQTGQLNNTGNTLRNITIVTGLLGYTVYQCSSNSSCFGYTCFFDYDSVGTATSSLGFCNATAVTSCIHDDSSSLFSPATASGSSFCVTNTTYRTCTSGVWGGEVSCSSGQTCSSGSCSGSSSTSGSGGAGSGTSAKTVVLKIINVPFEVSIEQGKTSVVSVDVRNDGTAVTQNVTLSVSGISWATVAPPVYSVLSAGNSKTFSINITVPGDAAISTYTVTISTSSTNATNSTSFTLKVLPGPAAAVDINQTLANQLSIFAELSANLTELEALGATRSDVEDIRALLSSARSKLRQANQSIIGGDYFTANSLLSDAASLLDEARSRMRSVGFGEPIAFDTTLFAIIGAVIAVVAFIVYLFWPTKQQKSFVKFRKTK
jgi:hypothetical protein